MYRVSSHPTLVFSHDALSHLQHTFIKKGSVLLQMTFPTVVFNCSCPLDRSFYFYS